MRILLTTLHAKYAHASLALPSLAACCRDLPGATVTIREYTINEPREHLLRPSNPRSPHSPACS